MKPPALLSLCAAVLLSGCTPPRSAPPPPVAGVCAEAAGRIDALAKATLAQGSAGMVVLVAQRNRVLFEKAWGSARLEPAVAMRPDTVFRYASLTKQFTAAAVLTLVEDGRLSLDDRLGALVPELPAAREVRVYDLLIQTSGIPDFAGDVAGLRDKAAPHTSAEMLRWIVRLTPQLDFAPGARWAYSNSNYALLGLIVERVSGRDFADYLRERVLAPASLQDIAWDGRDAGPATRALGYRREDAAASGFAAADPIDPSVPGPAGALRGPLGAMPRWYAALFGGRVLKPETLARMIAPGRLADGRSTRSGMPQDWQEGLQSDYAMGLFVRATEQGRYLWHGGDIDGFSVWAAYWPDSGTSVVMGINSQSADLPKDAIAALAAGPGSPCPFALAR